MPTGPSGARRPRRSLLPIGCLLAVGLLAATIAPLHADRHAAAAPGQPDVVIVGDSLTGGNVSYIEPTLRDAGLDVRIEGLSARRIAVSFDFKGRRDSGVERVRALRAAGVAPSLWVIELGSNDLGAIENCECSDPIGFAGAIIDELLAEIGPGVPIAWVTVLSRSRLDASRWFNTAIGIRAARDPHIALIRWHDLAFLRPDWFVDQVHQNITGVKAFTRLYIDRISALLVDPLGPSVTGPRPARATRLGPG